MKKTLWFPHDISGNKGWEFHTRRGKGYESREDAFEAFILESYRIYLSEDEANVAWYCEPINDGVDTACAYKIVGIYPKHVDSFFGCYRYELDIIEDERA
jgi:hypothetical protein